MGHHNVTNEACAMLRSRSGRTGSRSRSKHFCIVRATRRLRAALGHDLGLRRAYIDHELRERLAAEHRRRARLVVPAQHDGLSGGRRDVREGTLPGIYGPGAAPPTFALRSARILLWIRAMRLGPC